MNKEYTKTHIKLSTYSSLFLAFYFLMSSCSGKDDVESAPACAAPELCPADSTCVVGDDGDDCVCDAGFVQEGELCADVDECAEGLDDCVGESVSCENTAGSYECLCEPGFVYEDSACVDEDECQKEDSCPANADCINSIGSFECNCREGYLENNHGECVATTYLAVSASGLHSCGLGVEGDLYCWGDNSHGQLGNSRGGANQKEISPSAVGGGAKWLQADAGLYHTCAIKADNSLWCWGYDTEGQLGADSYSSYHPDLVLPAQVGELRDWQSVSAGSTHSCGIRSDKSLWCWGSNHFGELGNGEGDFGMGDSSPVRVGNWTDWESVSCGAGFSCGLRGDQSLWCWGNNFFGALGDGSGENQSVPTLLGEAGPWLSLSVGDSHGCAVKSDQSLWCWGYHGSGQVGVGDDADDFVMQPLQVGDSFEWISVTAGSYHSCGTQTGGRAFCWGDNRLGQLGDSTGLSRTYPMEVSSTAKWISLTSATTHSCGVDDSHQLYCWGDNTDGMLGRGREPQKLSPSEVLTGSVWLQVAAANEFSCAINDDDAGLYCWGKNNAGQLGINQPQDLPEPRKVGSDSWAYIATGSEHACGITQAGALYCWGEGSAGQVGDGLGLDSPLLVQIGDLTDWTMLSLGGSHSCALRSDSTLWCWGASHLGQVGDGSTGFNLEPVEIGRGIEWVDISLGEDHSCALDSDGNLWCWGDNSSGQLGDSSPGLEGDTTLPSKITTGIEWTALECGAAHCCGQQSDETLWCWGENLFGQLGDESRDSRAYPVQVGDVSWTRVSAGFGHSCGVQRDKSLWCWGMAGSGQLGTGALNLLTLPGRVGDGTDWTRISAGESHSCALREDASLWCWGPNREGELGDSDAWSMEPVAIGL